MPDALELVHEDAKLVAVNKPSGMLVHRGWANDDVVAVDLLHAQLGQRVWPLHRLDRGTSGVLLFALDVDTARELSGAFERGEVHKRYLALVRGHAPAHALIDHGLRHVDDKQSERKPAQTRVRRLAEFERYSVVEAEPLTGRTHQIRRHLKHIAHPIIGDVRYGKGAHNRMFRERFGLHRLALHAAQLRIADPSGTAELTICAPLPEDLSGPLAAMGIDLAAI
ncbi:tRNA pseudouridine synthase C [Enhygromyxa salina]|uniref:tRNA pseudouridine synthase C n=1 Tax=Enhygromyxa salina TaxID=215803 RepID=A0A0C2DAI3_9BACT|nr:pseudouridine synthase [Enhygromyxa salina]KIG16897.1 tRNA pseudouridine synthase C [Enhygromyxa salina]